MNDVEEQLRALSPAKRALFEQLSRQKPRAPEPIAIVGMGCRFPGAAVNPASYWSLLCEGGTAVREVPAARWNPDAYYSPDPEAPGKSVSRWGGFLSAVEWFDADLFGITPRQALHMDPQHRVLLEVAFEALEDAALPPLDLAGTRAGVYVGISFLDYAFLQVGRMDRIDALSAPGLGLHGAAGRISHAFGLEGPSLSVDTACSSSLVSVHLACQALRTSEVDLAMAAGVNLILSPLNMVAASKLRLLSPDGRCRPFDEEANGYVRGEGCGVLVLKRLTDAVMEGDRVLALIRGSAVNQDGRASGYAVPNGHAQRAVLRAALDNAGMAAADIGYVEAQGTGTPLGDVVEAEALADVFGRSRTHEHPLIVGSAKGNLGHLESASGMASIIKVVQALRYGEVPRNLNFQKLNPDIAQRRAPLLFPRDHTPWPRGVRARAAGVSAFGVAGTNAHIVLSEAPAPAAADPRPAPSGRHGLVVLSGRTDQAVWDGALKLHEALGKERDGQLHDLALTSTAGRSHLGSRLAICAASTADLEGVLNEFLWGRKSEQLFSGRAPLAPVRVGFVFSGEAADVSGSGQMLYRTQLAFQMFLDHLSELVRPWLEAPLTQVLWGDPGKEHRDAAVLAPAKVALELALVELWKSLGMIPDFVGGYGSGEYTAACVAGALTPADALTLAREQARLWKEHAPNQVAVRVQAPAERLEPLLGAGELSIVADEGKHCVVAGERSLMEPFTRALKEQQVPFAACRAPHGSGPAGLRVAEGMARAAQSTRFRPPVLHLFSAALGAEVPSGEPLGASHWVEHACKPVQSSAMVRSMEESGCDVFVEVGADSPFCARLGGRSRSTWIPTLAAGRDDDEVFLSAVGNLFVRGAVVNVRALGRPSATRKTDLPYYPFQRKRYWLDTEPAAGNSPAPPRPRRDLVTELAQTQEKERRPLLHRYVASEIAHVLGWESSAGLREDALFNEIGLDSILAVDMLSVLRRDLSMEIPAAVFYDYPTLGTLVKYLERALSLSLTPADGIARLTPQSSGGTPGHRG